MDATPSTRPAADATNDPTYEPPGSRAVDGTMFPPDSVLGEFVPSERFRPDGRPVGALRDQLYRIPNLANAAHVLGIWLQSVGVIALARWWGNPVGWVIAFLMCGRAMVRFAILMHEASHRLLFSNRRANDLVGKWLIAYPVFTPIEAYRRGHMAHHREEFGPREPDIAFYRGYPISPRSWWRKMRRDALGVSGWKNLKALIMATRSSTARPVVLRILATQVVMFALLWAVGGHWWVWPVFWLLPWMTVWRVLNRLRGRRTRWTRRSAGLSKDHTPRAPEPVGQVRLRSVQHRLPPGAPRRHRCATSAPGAPGLRSNRRGEHPARTRLAQLSNAVASRPQRIHQAGAPLLLRSGTRARCPPPNRRCRKSLQHRCAPRRGARRGRARAGPPGGSSARWSSWLALNESFSSS